MSFQVRLTEVAEDDLLRHYDFIIERTEGDWTAAERAIDAIRTSLKMLALSPFACRKADDPDPLLRELIIGFGSNGYVALFRIDDPQTVTVLAVRHQREDDYR